MKQAPRKLMIGCLLLKTHPNVSHCCNHCQVYWQWWQNLTHTWTTDRFDSESPQLLLNSCGQIILLTFSIPIKVVITKTTLGWADLLVIIFSKVCHLLVGGKRYSLIRVLISLFPHRIRQSRSEEKNLALIPLILRYTENKLNYLTSCTICLNKITNMDIKPNEKRSKPKTYGIISEGRFNAESDFKSILTV